LGPLFEEVARGRDIAAAADRGSGRGPGAQSSGFRGGREGGAGTGSTRVGSCVHLRTGSSNDGLLNFSWESVRSISSSLRSREGRLATGAGIGLGPSSRRGAGACPRLPRVIWSSSSRPPDDRSLLHCSLLLRRAFIRSAASWSGRRGDAGRWGGAGRSPGAPVINGGRRARARVAVAAGAAPRASERASERRRRLVAEIR